MILFESTLTTFEASFIFCGSCGNTKNWLELKIEPPLADLALLNPWNTLYNLSLCIKHTMGDHVEYLVLCINLQQVIFYSISQPSNKSVTFSRAPSKSNWINLQHHNVWAALFSNQICLTNFLQFWQTVLHYNVQYLVYRLLLSYSCKHITITKLYYITFAYCSTNWQKSDYNKRLVKIISCRSVVKKPRACITL